MLPLMPKATAIWLVENTSLTFEQIAEFCQIHPLEVKAIADGEAAVGMLGMDPVAAGQLAQSEIERCEANPNGRLHLTPPVTAESLLGKVGGRYTPMIKRQDKPDAISWLLKFHPELTDLQICRLLGTTKGTIQTIRERSHWNAQNIKPRNPVQLGLCSQLELNRVIETARKNMPKKSFDSGEQS